MRHARKLHELKLFGSLPLISLDTFTQEADDEAEAEEATGISGGSAHNFTLADNDATDEIDSEPWQEDRFGFGGPR